MRDIPHRNPKKSTKVHKDNQYITEALCFVKFV